MPPKNSGTVSYVGGKTTLAPWIINQFPAHECYVEPFAGSASVLFRKDKSDIEVYNDLNEDIVTLFRVARDRTDELINWLSYTPYARAEHDRLARTLKSRSWDTDIEHAGTIFYLLQASYGGNLQSISFKTERTKSSSQSTAERYEAAQQNLSNIADRFASVIIENSDYATIFNQYDGEDTFFYCDPPYLSQSTPYLTDAINHDEFASVLADADGQWLVSYDEIPDALSDYWTVTRNRDWTINPGKEVTGTETLVMNYNPTTTTGFVNAEHSQTKLSDTT